MNPTDPRYAELELAIAEQAEGIAAKVVMAIAATTDLHRPSTVSLIIKVARDADDQTKVKVTAQYKYKAPKSDYSDITSWGDVELLQTIDTGEEPGQQRITE